MKIHNTELTLVRGSVLEQPVAAIVNAANTGMRGGGGLDGALHEAAGPEMLRELEFAAPDGSHTAEVVVTRAHNLPQQWVFHVAGPFWQNSRPLECDALLSRSYRGCIESAEAGELESLAFPSISTGVFRFPLERAAPIAVATIAGYLNHNPQTSLRRVILAMFGQAEYDYFERELEKYENSRPQIEIAR